MENRMLRIPSADGKIILKALPGHFATGHAHTNYYLDMSTLKTRQSEAATVAEALARMVENNCIVDTVLCLDGTEVVGAYLAQELCRCGVQIMNQHETIYVVSPEYSNGQMVVRDNILPMINGKNVLLLCDTVSTGLSCKRSVESIRYYGGLVSAVTSIFSAVEQCDGLPIRAVFTPELLPGYSTCQPYVCPACNAGQKIQALVNAFGYSML